MILKASRSLFPAEQDNGALCQCLAEFEIMKISVHDGMSVESNCSVLVGIKGPVAGEGTIPFHSAGLSQGK
jgi:hypothetical protein